MAEPGRFIQTTLVYEDKAASFIFVEGLDRSALVELANERLARPVPSTTVGARTQDAFGVAAELIANPFLNVLRTGQGVHIDDIPGSDRWRQWTGALLQSELVIVTQSPPVQESFHSLAKMASGVVVGAWVGSQAAADLQPMLLFVLVPAGMVIVGAASGIATALENGLNQWLSRKLGAPKEPRRRAPPASKRRTASAKGKAKR
jgi:hypothetical protein